MIFHHYKLKIMFVSIPNPVHFDIRGLGIRLAVLGHLMNSVQWPLIDINSTNFNNFYSVLEHLWLDGNELVDVPDLSHLPLLKSVSLSSNPIEYIKTKAFFNLTELVKVYMSDLDFLIMIEERAFSNLPKLNELQISGCRKLQFIHAGAFEDTPMLRVLDLSGNGLHTVTDLWNTLPRLELIKLEHVSAGSYTWLSPELIFKCHFC